MAALRYPRFWLAVWLLMVAAVIMGSLMPARDIPVDMMHGSDKVLHFLGYFTLSAYAVMLFHQVPARWRAAAGLVFLGGFIELAQAMITTSRSAEFADFAVNALGVGAGLLLARTRAANGLQWLEALRQ